jgi:GGDEF domain-containing protein
MSVGVASLQADHPINADALLALADRALYAAKAQSEAPLVAFNGIQWEKAASGV